MVTALSPALAAATHPPASSAGEALLGCIQRAAHPGLLGPDCKPFVSSIVRDVEQIVGQGRPAMLCALCDLHRLTLAAQSQMKSGKMRPNGRHALIHEQADRPFRVTDRDLSESSRKPAAALQSYNEMPASKVAINGRGQASSDTTPDATAKSKHQLKALAKQAERKVWFCMCWVNEQRPAMSALLCQSLSSIANEMAHAPTDVEETQTKEPVVVSPGPSLRLQSVQPTRPQIQDV